MIATGLVIGDGVLMPAFSVNSAISGIQQHAAYITEGGCGVWGVGCGWMGGMGAADCKPSVWESKVGERAG